MRRKSGSYIGKLDVQDVRLFLREIVLCHFELQCQVYSRFIIAKMRFGIHVCGVLYGVAVNERAIQSVSRPCVRITGLITAILSNNRSHTPRL